MRRQFLKGLMMAAPAASVLAAPTRGIFTVWGSIPLEDWATKESWLKRITNLSKYRSFEFSHVPEVEAPPGLKLSAVELYLLSCVEDDTKRLLNISWTYDFDSFWTDRVNSHDLLYKALYQRQFPIYRFFLGDCSSNEAGRKYIEKKLNYLKAVLHWAAMTERRYTAIMKARFVVQREVWNALERERYLMGCVEIVESFKTKVPAEFAAKAIGELETELGTVRHWVWDCPNAKRTYKQLA
ncbi:succinate dehydrogenase subunit [Trypanosoma conorhini]|uniref:Succinate dehydrogenase subunit n=1 Tax=Trypanosoma conorhini TaxID=83891 RepID=A0A422PDD9_9TRYP|nr:succinate dehydrogenase subunit [Trypanosoma conorhini]RNF15729.1 succinate dehydrogenase subunit [Trypanosoma conorhini]